MAIRPAQNVIQLFGVCNDARDGKLRIVMELCTHGSLRSYVKSLPPSQVCVFLCAVILLVPVGVFVCVSAAEYVCARSGVWTPRSIYVYS